MQDFEHARTTMVDSQIRPADVTKFPVIQAFLAVPKEALIPQGMRSVAYADNQIPIDDFSRRVILDARSFAKMLDAVDIQPDELVLDLGCGYGYSAAVIARLAEAVVAVEEIKEIAVEAETLLIRHDVYNAIVTHAPLAEGDARHGPYDVIVVEGAIEQLPVRIGDQLKDSGRIVSLVSNGGVCCCRFGKKIGKTIHWRRVFDSGAPVLPGFQRTRSFDEIWASEPASIRRG